MSIKEMYDALAVDARKVQIRMEKNYPKVVKMFMKSRSFPASYIDEYTIPSTNNHYILFFYASDVSEVKKPHYASFCVVFNGNQRFVIKRMMMGYKHTPMSEMVMLPQIHAYTSHFFQRYNERFLHKDNMTTNEIAGMFFVRNVFPMPIMLNEDVNRKFKEYGKNNDRGMRVHDGFCFTQTAIEGKESENGDRNKDIVDAMVIIYTTYMNESDMTDNQIAAINNEHLKTWIRCMEDLRRFTCPL